MRPEPAKMRMPQPEIPKFLRLMKGLKGAQGAAEISIKPSSFERPRRKILAKALLHYAIDNWLNCNRTIATDSVTFPWMAQMSQRTSLQTNQQIFEKVAIRRNDSFGVHP